MILKLLETAGTAGLTATIKSSRISLKSKKHCFKQSKVLLCSKKSEDPSELSGEEKIKKLLNRSSPLKINEKLDVDNEIWETSAYPSGTVFRDDKEKQPEDDEPKTIILFPGQGNQYVGMAKNLLKYPIACEMFDAASEILKYNLLKVCNEGPEEKLNETKCCQAATFVCSLALLEKVKDEKPWVISSCTKTCGYSLGELTALVFAGCLNFEKGLKLVKVRAEEMSDCCKKYPGGMLTVFTGPFTKLSEAIKDSIEYCKSLGIENVHCCIASYLFPNCKVIAGNLKALEFIENNAKKYEIRRHSRLPVSGAFHTELMKDAAVVFKEKLAKIQLNEPLIQIFSNVKGKPYKNSQEILKLLPKQIYLPVKWEQIVHKMFSHRRGAPLPMVYECGPGISLLTTVRKINFEATPVSFSIQM